MHTSPLATTSLVAFLLSVCTKRSILVFITLLSILLLAGCSSAADDIREQLTETIVVKKIPVQISVPVIWRQIPEDELEKIGPRVILAFSDNSADGRGVRNLSVVEERLEDPLSSLQYAYANIALAAKNLEDYEKIQETEVPIQSAENTEIKTRMQVFEARFDRKNPKRKYLQLYAAQGYYGYTFTIQTVLDDANLVQLQNLLTSFRLVKE